MSRPRRRFLLLHRFPFFQICSCLAATAHRSRTVPNSIGAVPMRWSRFSSGIKSLKYLKPRRSRSFSAGRLGRAMVVPHACNAAFGSKPLTAGIYQLRACQTTANCKTRQAHVSPNAVPNSIGLPWVCIGILGRKRHRVQDRQQSGGALELFEAFGSHSGLGGLVALTIGGTGGGPLLPGLEPCQARDHRKSREREASRRR